MEISVECKLYQSISSDVLKMEQQRDDVDVVHFLTGLRSKYEPIRAQILGSPKLPSLPDVLSLAFSVLLYLIIILRRVLILLVIGPL